VAAEEAGVGEVGDAVELLGAPREHEGVARGPAQRSVDRQGDAHVHHVAEGVTDQGVRPVHRPGEALPLRLGEEDVLLVVVEVVDREAGLGLAEGRVRRLGCVGVEGAEVVLEPGDERHVLELARPAGGGQQVGEHGSVDALVVRLRLLPRPGREHDVAELVPLQGAVERVGVEDVPAQLLDPGDVVAVGAGQAEDPPAGGGHRAGGVEAGDAGDPDDEDGA